MLPIFTQIIIALVMMAVSYALMPRPKQPKPDSMKERMENPTAEAGLEIPLVVGTVLIESPNVLHFTQKATETQEIDA